MQENIPESMSDFMRIGIEAVKKAEIEIMNVFHGQADVQVKPDKTLVTQADQNAEQIIKEVISKHFPEHNFYGEEHGKCDPSKGYVWAIDPIDGTVSFIRKLPLFATLLALIKDGEFILGIANFPVTNELFIAEKGKGAYLNGNPVSVSQVSDINRSLLCHGTITEFAKEGSVNKLLDIAENNLAKRGYPGPEGYYYMLKGQCELMLDPSLDLYDVAAMKVLIEEAGGNTYNLNGDVFRVTDKNFVATNGRIDDEVLPILRDKS